MKEAIIIYADEGRDFEATSFEGDPPLKWLQDAVGGLIESVWLPDNPDDLVMWAHEEALLRNEPVLNMVASRFARRPIFGDVVVVVGVDA